jgi:hypothetical protein
MGYKDLEERRKYHREWRLRTPERLEADRERCRLKSESTRNRRSALLSEFSCVLCGECDPDLIDWHHVNPGEKQLNIKGCGGASEERWWSEVLKCIPLCALCHRKTHQEKLCLLPISL